MENVPAKPGFTNKAQRIHGDRIVVLNSVQSEEFEGAGGAEGAGGGASEVSVDVEVKLPTDGKNKIQVRMKRGSCFAAASSFWMCHRERFKMICSAPR